ncbi:MAG TPA: hypothetical protein VFD70_27080 [Anaerolineae bacterium]|nr:hypothetical protein [Anaerolineae bacterium]
MSASNETEIQKLLQEFQNPSAKRREALAKTLGTQGQIDPRLLNGLWQLANADRCLMFAKPHAMRWSHWAKIRRRSPPKNNSSSNRQTERRGA